MATLKKATFDKIVTATENFVNERKGKWGEDEWLDLLAILKQLGVDLNEEMQAYVRQLVEAMRGVYQATGSTQGMTKALTSATKDSVDFVKVHKAIWGYSDWEDFAGHVKTNTRVISKETSSYLNDILESLKGLLGKNTKETASPAQQTAPVTPQAAPAPAAPKPAPTPQQQPAAPKAQPVAKPEPKPQTSTTAAKTETPEPKTPAKSASPAAKPKPAPAKAKAKPAGNKPATPASTATTKAAPAPASDSDKPDDLTAITGIGPALQKKLNNHGITQYAQLAALSPADIEHLENDIIKFSGRIKRDGWIAQASELMKK